MPKTARQICQLLGGKTRGEAVLRATSPDHTMSYLFSRMALEQGCTIDQAAAERYDAYISVGLPSYLAQKGDTP